MLATPELASFAREGALAGPSDVYDRYADPHQATTEESGVGEIHDLARNGLRHTGHHPPIAATGVPGSDLPQWEYLQILTAQLARFPSLE